MLDADRIACDLVRALRGRRAQGKLSRQLGFGSNVLYAWESGRRSPEWSSFVKLAVHVGIPVRERLGAFFGDGAHELVAERPASQRATQRLVALLAAAHRRLELAARLSVDRTTLSRWLLGRTEPRLPDVFRLLEATTQRLLPFVALFADPRALPSTRAAARDLMAQQKLAYELPWSHAVLRALELRAYAALPRHRRGWLASQLDLSPGQEQRLLRALARAGQIRWDGTRFRVERVLAVDTRADPARNLALKAHWAEVGLQRLRTAPPDDALFSFNLFAIDEARLRAIRELHLAYYEQVRALVDGSDTADRVVLLNLQLLPLSCATP